MVAEQKVDFIQPTIEEQGAFWKDIKDVCEKHSMVLSTGFSIQKAIKVNAIDKKDVA